MWFFRLIANALAPLTLIGAIAAYLYPPLFVWLKPTLGWLIGITMLALGSVLRPEELIETLRRPQRLGAGLVTQYTVMPLLGFLVARFAGLPDAIAVGFIIVACAPGAMASNVIVYLAGGAVAFSIALTTLATLLSPLVTPALVELLGGAFVPVEFRAMMMTILYSVVLPLLAGMGLRHLLGARAATAEAVAPAVAAIAIVLICSFVVAANQARLAVVGPTIMGLVIVLNLLGYLFGYLAGRLWRFDDRHRLTLAIEIGMQNAGLGVALASIHFSPEAALPGALFAAWSVLSSAAVAAWLRRRHHRQALLTP